MPEQKKQTSRRSGDEAEETRRVPPRTAQVGRKKVHRPEKVRDESIPGDVEE